MHKESKIVSVSVMMEFSVKKGFFSLKSSQDTFFTKFNVLLFNLFPRKYRSHLSDSRVKVELYIVCPNTCGLNILAIRFTILKE